MSDVTPLSHIRARIARAEQRLRQFPDDADAAAAVRDARDAYAAAKLEQHIRQVVDEAPVLSTEQRIRLAALLNVAS